MIEEIIFLTGLPKSGITLLNAALACHPEIAVSQNSELFNIISAIRTEVSKEMPFSLGMAKNTMLHYKKIENSTRAFIQAWSENSKKITVDENYAWLRNIELISSIFPNFKIIVCISDLRQVYAALEKKHRETLLIKYNEEISSDVISKRFDDFFSKDGLIGKQISGILNLKNFPNISDHLFVFRYEDLISNFDLSMDLLFNWMGVEKQKLTLKNIIKTLSQGNYQSNPKTGDLFDGNPDYLDFSNLIYPSKNIFDAIFTKNEWFFREYYPEYIKTEQTRMGPAGQPPLNPYIPVPNEIESKIAEEIEKELSKQIEKELSGKKK